MLILVIHGQLNTLVVYLELGDQTSQQLIYIIELVCCTVTHIFIYIYIYTHTQSARDGLILVVRKVQNQVGILKKKKKKKKGWTLFSCAYIRYTWPTQCPSSLPRIG